MIWMKYQTHEYMDMYPEYGFRLFEDREQAFQWEKHMSENYSGGTTTIIGPATQEEILKYIKGMSVDDLTLKNIHNKDYYE